jgi:hypothetical protein
MKSKFIGTIVAIAVVLSMVMVPAVTLALPSVAGMEVVPNETKVGFTQDFDLEIWGRVPGAQAWDTGDVHLDFNPTYMGVNFITNGALPTVLGSAYNNATGTIDFTSGILGSSVMGDQLICTVNCTSKGVTGVSTIDFVNIGPLRITDIINGGMSLINWTLVVNGTLKVGSPALTVDVSPAGKGDVKINGVAPGSYPDVSYWAWDEVVSLNAANPAAGWAFDHWTGNLTGSTNPDNVTMSDAMSVTAVFAELPCDLDVDPNVLNLEARFGVDEDSDTVTIANDGGGTLCWALGDPPTWGVGDWWNYYNFYQPFAPAWQMIVPGSNASFVNTSVVGGGSGSDYACVVNIAPPLQRSMMGGMPCVLYSGSMVVDECTLDIASQIGIMGIYPYAGSGCWTEVPVQANLSWAYDSCHGWPYYLGKAWNYNLTMNVKTLGTWSPVDYKVIPAMAMVTGWNTTLSAWEITHLALPSMTPFMQTWWSPTAKNFVQQADGGTYDFPPMDVRSLVAFSTAAPPAGPASWLSFDKTHGALGIGGSELLTVTANSSGLAVGSYNTSFTISACGSVQSETVDVSLNVLPATSIDAIRDLPADALDYDAEYPGDTFNVTINFTAPVDAFNSIGLTDYAPAGWEVETNVLWCTPVADWTMSPYNKAEYAWAGPFAEGTNFTVVYKVTIPATANPGSNFWPNCTPGTCPPCEGSPQNMFAVWVEYWFDADGPFESCITGEIEKIVTVPGCETGETRDVLGNVLDTVLVTLYEDDDVWEDDDSSSIVGGIAVYEDCADDTGYYYKIATKYCYFPLDTRPVADGGSIAPPSHNPNYPAYIDWSTPELLAAGNVLNFVGDYGLVCRAASMSMAMEAVNHMLFVPLGDDGITPEPDWQLSNWKAMEVVHSWQFPCGCNC